MPVFRNLRRRKNYSGDVWTTKDGTSIPVEDMTDSHLSNAIAHVERWADRMAIRADRLYEPSPWDSIFGWPQGEMAQLHLESAMWDDEFDCEPMYDRYDFLNGNRWYEMLIRERDRRAPRTHNDCGDWIPSGDWDGGPEDSQQRV